MADYWITFRLHDDATYQQRYRDFIAAVNDNGTGFWEGPTSFICIRSNLGIDGLGAKIKAPLKADRDMFVLRELGKDNTRYFGDPGDGFNSFFPNAKKL